MVFGSAFTASTLLALGAIFRYVIGLLADLACTRLTRFLALLRTITNTVTSRELAKMPAWGGVYRLTLLATESTSDGGSLNGNEVLWALANSVTELTTVVALLHATIHGNAGIA